MTLPRLLRGRAGVLAALLALLLLVAAGSALRAKLLYDDLLSARTELSGLETRLSTLDPAITAAEVQPLLADLAAADARLATLQSSLDGDPTLIPLRIAPVAGTQVDAASKLVRAARELTSHRAELGRLLDGYVAARDGQAGSARFAAFARLLGSEQAAVTTLLAAVRAADDDLRAIPESGVAAPIGELRTRLLARIDPLRSAADRGGDLVAAIPALAGVGGSSHYLVVALDNAEIRPVGGLITAYATPTFRDGVLAGLDFHDIYDADHPAQATYVEPPPGLKGHLLGDTRPWQVADAGWWPDWEQDAAEIRRLFVAETGDTAIQGVIGFTPEVVDRLLEIVGPVTIASENTTVHAGETYLLSLEQAEVLHRGVGRKAFLAELASAVYARVMALPPEKLPEVALAFADAARAKQLRISIDGVAGDAVAKMLGGRDTFGFEAGVDRLAVFESNVAPVSKLNAITSMEHRLEVVLAADGSATETLRTTYHNRYDEDLGAALERVRITFRGGNLGSYSRRYLDPDAELLGVSSDGSPAVSGPERISTENGSLVVASYLYVKPGQQTLETRYRVPGIVAFRSGTSGTSGAGTYTLRFVKQAGRDHDALTIRITPPPGTKAVTWSAGGQLVDGVVVFSTSSALDATFSISFEPAG